MAIRYYVAPISTDEDNTRYYGRVITGKGITQAELIHRMQLLGTTITTVDMVAVLEALGTVSQELLKEGHHVKVNKLCTLSPSIEGTFKDETDTYDPKRHKLKISARSDAQATKALRETAKLKKVNVPYSGPRINKHYAFLSDSENSTVQSGQLNKIRGYNLKLNPENNDETIAYIDIETNIKYPVIHYSEITPKQIIFQAPIFPDEVNTVRIEITGRNRKESIKTKSYVFDTVLAVTPLV